MNVAGRTIDLEVTMTTITAPASRAAGPTAMRIGAVSGVVGVATLLGMYACFAAGATEAGMRLGFVNDCTVFITYPAVVPGVLAIRRALRVQHPRVADAGTAVAFGAMGVTLVAQGALVTGLVPFERQVAWAAAGFLVFGGWLIVSGWVGGRDRTLPYGPGLGAAATLLVGFPTWALRVARWMERTRP